MNFLPSQDNGVAGEGRSGPCGRGRDMTLMSDPVPFPTGAGNEDTRRQADDAGQAGERRFRALIEHSCDAVALIGADGTAVYASPATTRILGYPVPDFVGRNIFSLMHPEDLPHVTGLFSQLLREPAGGMTASFRFQHQDGSWRWIEGTGTNLLGEPGVQAVVANFHDVTERKQAEAQLRAREEQLRFQLDLVNTIASRAAEALVVTDADGRVTFLNAAAEQMFGWKLAELRGENLHDAIHRHSPDGSPLPPTECDMRQVLAEGKTLPHHEDAFYRRDGTLVPVSCSKAAIVRDGKVTGAVLVAIDISERKRLEEELRRQAADLAEADRHKDEFLAVLGHELRNPLAPIRNALHVLHLRGADPPTLAWAHDVTQRQLRHLTRLVDDLLDVSRINRGKLRLRPERTDLAQIVRRTADDHRSALEEASLALRLEVPLEPVPVVGDPTRLAQVVGNLLHNAVKFTDPGGRVTVRVGVDGGGERALVTVADTGIGIEPEQLPGVFETFRQEERSLDRNRGGLGLGLALVRGLVDMHGGQVRATSAGIGHGTEFTFWLPLARQGEAPGEQPSDAAPTGTGLRILIIEDYRDVAETLQKFLEFSGHQVAVAHSGPAGVVVARQTQPDVVLCDLGLPGMDGLAVARTLRQDPATSAARLITMSGYGSETDQRRCLEAGFELHLTKPVDPEELERVLAAGPPGTPATPDHRDDRRGPSRG